MHTFHLPFGEMTITLEDVQKILGLRVSGHPVTGTCESVGWRDRVQAFLGRDLPTDDGADRTAGVRISWLDPKLTVNIYTTFIGQGELWVHSLGRSSFDFSACGIHILPTE
jgi:hypothetical protein